MMGRIFEIKRFAVHDGDGIRTTVFLKGCTMKCVWCHNPESISPNSQLAFYQHKCAHCGLCVQICGQHMLADGKHQFDKTDCKACGRCADACLNEALRLYGEERSVQEIMPFLLEDVPFYTTSGGGITVSGGECLLQAQFCTELLAACKQNGLHTAVDTCGNVPWQNVEAVLPYTDIFLYDVKAIDEDVHKKCTGASNKHILDNLLRIDRAGKPTEIRIPYVPGHNDDQMDKIGQFLSTLQHIVKVRVLPYHDLARSKYASLQMPDTMPAAVPSADDIKAAEDILCRCGLVIGH